MKKSKDLTVLIILFIVVALVAGILFFVNVNKNKDKNDNKKQTTEQKVNYVEEEEKKINTSSEVKEDKILNDLKIEKTNLVYEDGISVLTSKVTNNGDKLEEVYFTIKFYDNSNSLITEAQTYIGSIGKGEIRNVNSSITDDVSNAKKVEYEILKTGE